MGSNSIAIGQYLPGDTFLHNMDPRAKLAALVLLIVAIFKVTALWAFVPFVLLVLFLYFIGKVPVKFFIKGIRPIIYIVLITMFLHLFFTNGGEVLFRYGILTIETAGLKTGLFTVFRLMLLVFYTMLITLTTTPLSLTGGMEYFLNPLKYFKIPVSEISMILTISLRFIPTLIEESERIVRAQKARGVSFDDGNIFKKIRFLAPVIVPLFMSAFRRADELAVAMESRCYSVGKKRTRMYELIFTPMDYFVMILSGLILISTLIWLA